MILNYLAVIELFYLCTPTWNIFSSVARGLFFFFFFSKERRERLDERGEGEWVKYEIGLVRGMILV